MSAYCPARRSPRWQYRCKRNTPQSSTVREALKWTSRRSGERIRELRRGIFTQTDLAAAADVSVDVIRKLEQGRRHTASIGTLQRIARALDVDIGRLLGPSRPVSAAGEPPTPAAAIRDVLTSVDDLPDELDDVDAPDLTELGRAVSYAWGLFYAGRYGPLAAMLPRLLTEAQAVTHAAPLTGSARAADLAAQVHQVTAVTLLRFGAPDLGYVGSARLRELAHRLSATRVPQLS